MSDENHQLRLELIEYKFQSSHWKRLYEQSAKKSNKLQEEVDNLKRKLKKRERQLFGKKSEKQNLKKISKETDKKRGQQKTNPQPPRRTYDHLPTNTEEYAFENECICSVCGKIFDDFGKDDESEVLEIEVKSYRRKIVRKKVKKSCQCCGGTKVMTASGPNKLFPGSRIGISIWVELLMNKFLFGQPIHRTLNYLSTLGLNLAGGTITGGLRHFNDLFQPVTDAIHAHCLSASFWHADETGWKVFEKISTKETTRWYLWLFESSDAAVYIADPTRSAKVIEKFFDDDSSGILMVDRYIAYQCYVKKNTSMHLSFCWAHIRRGFLDYAKDYPKFEEWAFEWIERIRNLYDSFALSREKKTDGFYLALEKTANSMWKSVLIEFQRTDFPHGHKRLLGILHDYWDELTRFTKDHDLPIDNNEAERSLRTPVVGRKNFYGSGSVWSAELAAQCYSIFKTLSMNNINIREWLFDYLNACARAGGKTPDCIEIFLPWNSHANKDHDGSDVAS